jgi:hypothetical protein
MMPPSPASDPDRSPRLSPARLGESPPLTTVAAMFAFSPDRQSSHLQSQGTTDGTRRFVRNGVAQPGVQPASHPHAVPLVPATAPAEPDHERAYPQADGEP